MAAGVRRATQARKPRQVNSTDIRNMAKAAAGGTKTAGAAAKPRAVKAAPVIDTALVRELAELVGETGVAEIEVKRGDLKIRVARYAAPAAVAAHPVAVAAASPVATAAAVAPATKAAAPAAELSPRDNPDALKSPMVGTAYLKPSPEAKQFVEIGSEVKAGDKVLLIEAMKTFNDIVAHKAGKVTALLVDNAQPVEFGQPLIIIS
jgi:acetyl-CoA carboxylase biotin carboxyl carrier protein